MKKFWKTYFGHCIYQTSGGISVYQNSIYRWITENSQTIQSLINRHFPERTGLRYIQTLTLGVRALPGNACLLGLGGAGVAHTLDKVLGTAELDAIEINPEIIRIAAEYFMTSRLKQLRTVQQDAYDYVQHCQKKYLHIMVDLFSGDRMPTHCYHESFFGYCKHLLMPGGILAINLACKQDLDRSFNVIKSHFNRCTLTIPIRGSANWVVLAYKGDSIQPILNVFQNNSGLKKIIWDSQWGYMAQ